MNTLSIMMKPASSLCDLDCKYCFYKDVSNNREDYSYDIMSSDVYKELIDKAFESKHDHIMFGFQGGEPLLAGIEFFEEFIKHCKEKQNKKTYSLTIQTNGYNIDNKWIKLFKENNILIGISVDGIKSVHNELRPKGSKDTYDTVMNNIDLLKANNIDFNVLCVLSKQLENYGSKVFENFVSNGFDFVQIIECLPEFNLSVEASPYACTPKVYKHFYTDFYKAWLNHLRSKKYMSVNTIDDIVRVLTNQMPTSCGRLGFCGVQHVFEADGSMYPCDFYVLDKYNLGNINNKEIKDLVFNNTSKDFIDEKRKLRNICYSCEYLNVCNTGCKRINDCFVSDDLCGYQSLVDLIRPDIEEILQLLSEI